MSENHSNPNTYTPDTKPRKDLSLIARRFITGGLVVGAAITTFMALNKTYDNKTYTPTTPSVGTTDILVQPNFNVRMDPRKTDTNSCFAMGTNVEERFIAGRTDGVYIEDNDNDPNGPWYGFNIDVFAESVRQACDGDIDNIVWIAQSGLAAQGTK